MKRTNNSQGSQEAKQRFLAMLDELAGIGEVHDGGEEGGGGDNVGFLLGRQVGQGAGKQGATEAITNGVDGILAGGFLDGGDGLQWAFAHVVGEILLGHLGIGKIKTPAFLLAASEDHIAPWKSTYAATGLLSGPM